MATMRIPFLAISPHFQRRSLAKSIGQGSVIVLLLLTAVNPGAANSPMIWYSIGGGGGVTTGGSSTVQGTVGQSLTGEPVADGVFLQAGPGIALSTNGNTLLISLASPGGPFVRGSSTSVGLSSVTRQELEKKIQTQAAQLEENSREIQNLKTVLGKLNCAVQKISSEPISQAD